MSLALINASAAMKTRWKILLPLAALLLVLLLATLFALLSCPDTEPAEPSYGGKKLSQWIEMLPPLQPRLAPAPAINAISQIGTNGIPCYLKWLQYEPPAWKNKFWDLGEKIPVPVVRDELLGIFLSEKGGMRFLGAADAFRILGPKAKDAVPELFRILTNSMGKGKQKGRWEPEGIIGNTITSVGADAIPSLQSFLTDQDANVRFHALFLITSLAGTNAHPPVPVLLKLTEDQDRAVRNLATNILRKVAPEALTNAPGRPQPTPP